MNESIKNSAALRYSLYVIGFALMLLVVWIHPQFYMYEPLPVPVGAIYTILGRPAFVVGLMLIIYPALLGKCRGSVLLSNEFWACLARSTYCAYMLHLIILQYYIATLEEGIFFTVHKIILNALDVVVITYILSFVITLLYESPVVQLSKLIFTRARPAIKAKTKEKEQNTTMDKLDSVPDPAATKLLSEEAKS